MPFKFNLLILVCAIFFFFFFFSEDLGDVPQIYIENPEGQVTSVPQHKALSIAGYLKASNKLKQPLTANYFRLEQANGQAGNRRKPKTNPMLDSYYSLKHPVQYNSPDDETPIESVKEDHTLEPARKSGFQMEDVEFSPRFSHHKPRFKISSHDAQTPDQLTLDISRSAFILTFLLLKV